MSAAKSHKADLLFGTKVEFQVKPNLVRKHEIMKITFVQHNCTIYVFHDEDDKWAHIDALHALYASLPVAQRLTPIF